MILVSKGSFRVPSFLFNEIYDDKLFDDLLYSLYCILNSQLIEDSSYNFLNIFPDYSVISDIMHEAAYNNIYVTLSNTYALIRYNIITFINHSFCVASGT